MKKLSIFSMLLMAVGFGAGMSSCSDMLEKDSSDKVYVSAQDTLYSYWGIMQKVQGIVERNVIINEVKGDLVSGSSYVSDSVNNIANYEAVENGSNALVDIKDYYAVINNCNLYLESCDTAAIKNNKQYMMLEYAQVLAIRAWTYLQMVNLYGEVPFYTQGIRSLSFLDSYDGKTVTKDNLANELGPQLLQIQSKVGYDYPSYGSYDTGGGVSISASLCMFHPYLVYADMQLAAGNYYEAAYRYWEWLQNNEGYLSNSCFPMVTKSRRDDGYTYSVSNYTSMFTGHGTGSELITVIPSSSNKQFGKMLTGVVNLYGYSTNSTQSTEEGSEDDGSDASTSASLALTLNYKKELEPSQAYLELNKAQYYATVTGHEFYPGDARGTAGSNASFYRSTNTDDNQQYYFIQKFCPSRSFTYQIPVYRKSLVWLRFAEAINRMGFPGYAFAILKDGLCAASLPKIESYKVTEVDEEGNVIDEKTLERFVEGEAYCIDSAEYVRAQAYPQLDFTNDKWTNSSTYTVTVTESGVEYKNTFTHAGIHMHGCGDVVGKSDTLHFDYAKMLEAVNLTTDSPLEDRVDAVENMIVDEMALECAFEGYRFSDLVRIAAHKSQAGADGNLWFATKVASRQGNGEVDRALLEKLRSSSNWYLKVPNWK